MAKKRTGLFDKLFILHLLCTTVLFLIIIVTYYQIEKRSFDNSLIKKSGVIRDLLEISCVDPIVNTIAYDRINQSIDAIYQKNREIVYIEIYDPTAHIIASVGTVPTVHFSSKDINILNTQDVTPEMSPTLGADGVELIAYLKAGKRNLGLIRIEFTKRYLHEQLVENSMYFLGIFIIAIAITSLIFYVFTNAWIVSPVIKVSKIMENYGRDELRTILSNIKKYNQKISGDEIGVMSLAFEKMVSSIIARTGEKEKAESQYRLIAENIADVIWTLDMELNLMYISPSIYQLRGYSVEEAMGQSLEEFVPSDSLELMVNLYQKKVLMIEAGDPGGWEAEEFEIEQYCKDGTTIWTSNTMKIFPGSDSLPAGVMGSTRNITERKQAESALIESEQSYREIFNATSDAIFIHDPDTGAILDVNQGMMDMFGSTYREAVQGNADTFSLGEPPYSSEEAAQKIAKTILHGSQSFDWLCRKKSGDLFWGEVSLKYVESSGKRYILAVMRDVNDRKLAEKALAAEKEQLAVTLRSIGDGVITTDTSGNIVLLNKVAEKLTGWTNEEAVGLPSEDVFHIINEQSGTICDNPVVKVINSGRVVGLANHTVLISKNGKKLSIADSGAPILDATSNIIGVVLVFRDVTERHKLEQEALKARKLESVGILAGGIAHDFNNILTAILGNINLALEHTKPKESIYALLFEAEKASLRAKGLTQQLLTFSKGGEPVRKITSIAEVITDSSSFVLRGSNVRCDTWFAPDLLPVDVDPGQVSQVIQNIIINGAHAMPQGGVIDIRVENVLDRQQIPLVLSGKMYVVIHIKDHGVGISSTVLNNIFDPYFSTKQTGSGLGLAICHSIITRHEGHISVQSEPGQGAIFSIYLPASRDQLPERKDKENDQVVHVNGRIMIMDDEQMVLKIAKAMLIRLGYEVELTAGGEEAIALYKKSFSAGTQADLIVMDLTIPGGMGGKEAVKGILAINPEAKILVSSGYSNDPIMANHADYGFCGAIVKPYEMQELNMVIQKALLS